MRERSALAAGVALQVLVLVGMVVLRLVPLMTGETVLLRVVPVDPRDLFRGDYVTLGYEFSRTPLERIDGLPGALLSQARGRTVYVSLVQEEDGRHWRAERISVLRPQAGTFIRGQIGAAGTLEFGIDAFYVQEGRGLDYENAVRDGRLAAEVAVTSSGWAALRALRIE
jgi:uncharacterized membrane-anchored protein